MPGIDDIARTAGLKPGDVKSVFEAILQLAHRGEPVRVTGFGSFNRRVYKGRTLTSPRINDGKPTQFADSYSLRFKQSTSAKHRLNTVKKAPDTPKVTKKTPPTKATKTPPPKKD